ncbi:obscurin-like [Astyanax mexicanus]|uniref:Obscurin-like n=1 Tax=Astyanax mexicanus TaxID=7994 RepID=A0A8T2LGW4_ASTMX|nr:obscurin-like [Astyanax mexicanus]
MEKMLLILNKIEESVEALKVSPSSTFSTFRLALPITFKQELKNQEVEEGNSATLRCELSKAGVQVEWWKGDVGEELLKSGEKYQMRQTATKVELVIRKAVPEDSGVYWCIFLFSALPVTFKQTLRNQETVEGNSITLRCELSKPGASVKWWKGQEVLSLGEKYYMKTEGRIAEMIVRNVVFEDAGSYSCSIGDQKTTSEIKVRGRSWYYWDSFFYQVNFFLNIRYTIWPIVFRHCF